MLPAATKEVPEPVPPAVSVTAAVADPALPLSPHQRLAWLFYLYVLTSLNDVGQFISGTLFGRHRIAPGISPNKTWQGLLGGVAASLLLSLALGSYLHLAGGGRLAAFAVLLSLGGFCGDLMFSAAKRVLGVKDFSQLIPGHGGILDRVDSLVVTAPLLEARMKAERSLAWRTTESGFDCKDGT
eukprot:gene28386-35232_t